MAGLRFEEVRRVLNLSHAIQIDEAPQRQDHGWQTYRAEHRVHLQRYPLRIIYVSSEADKASIEAAALEFKASEIGHLIFPGALQQRSPLLSRLCKEYPGRVFSLLDYFLSYFQTEVDRYLSELSRIGPKDFVDVKVQTPSGFWRKRPNPIWNFLTDDPLQVDKVAVVLGEPGQGKTYLCKHVAARLAKPGSRTVPIFVDSSQWESLPPDSLTNLSKTIVHSFRAFSAPIASFEGHEELCLRTLLRVDLVRLIFDGFDEYILKNQGRFSASEVLDALASLARETGARVVLSSRTSYWNQVKETLLAGEEGVLSAFDCFEIANFERQEVRLYFERKLKTPQANRALSLFDRLAQADSDLARRGFCLSLLADLAEREGQSDVAPPNEQYTLRWLLERICEREQRRQSLLLSPREQLRLFEEFAEAIKSNEPADSETLRMLIELYHEETVPADKVDACLQSLASHPLVQKGPAEKWEFRQEAVFVELLAARLVEKDSDLTRILKNLDTQEHVFRRDLVAAMKSNLLRGDKHGGRLEVLREFLARIVSCDGDHPCAEVRFVAGHALMAFVSEIAPLGQEKASRSRALRALVGEPEVRRLAFEGDITSLALEGMRFSACRFDHVRWTNCAFDNATVFEGCEFRGGAATNSKGLGSAQRVNCRLDPEAAEFFRREEIAIGGSSYSRDDLKRDIEHVVRKFVSKGGLGFATIRRSDLKRGRISASPYATEILAVIEKRLLEEHAISGVKEGGLHLRPEAEDALRFLDQNGVLTGALERVFEEICKKLQI